MPVPFCCAAPLRNTAAGWNIITTTTSQRVAVSRGNMRQTGSVTLALVRLAENTRAGGGGVKTLRTFHCDCCATDHFQRVKSRKFAANYSQPLGCKPAVLPALREKLEHHSCFLEPPSLDVPGVLLLPPVYCLLHMPTAF